MSSIAMESNSSSKAITNGAIAGLAGGVVFGAMMGMMSMLPMVGMLVRVENAVAGFIIHMAISAFIGAVYGFIASHLTLSSTTALVGGLVNGVVWWVLGALILMPLMLGMSQMVFVIQQPQMMSLLGHIIYGLITSYTFLSLARRN